MFAYFLNWLLCRKKQMQLIRKNKNIKAFDKERMTIEVATIEI